MFLQYRQILDYFPADLLKRLYKFEELLMRVCLLTTEPVIGVSYNIGFSFCLDFVRVDFFRYFDYGSMHSVTTNLPSPAPGTKVPFRVFSSDDVAAIRCSDLRDRRGNDYANLHKSWRELMDWIQLKHGGYFDVRGHLAVEHERNTLLDNTCVVGLQLSRLLSCIESCRTESAPFQVNWRNIPSSGALNLSLQIDYVNSIPNFLYRKQRHGTATLYTRYQTDSARYHVIYGSPFSIVIPALCVNDVPCVRPFKRRRQECGSSSHSAGD